MMEGMATDHRPLRQSMVAFAYACMRAWYHPAKAYGAGLVHVHVSQNTAHGLPSSYTHIYNVAYT